MSDLAINEKEVSLFNLKTELAQLMQLREDPELSDEEREVVEMQITLYVGAELRKVDNVRAYLRHCDMMQTAAAEEVKRLSALGAMWKGRQERLKDLCKTLMVEFGEKRLEGLHGAIALKGNGGLEPLELSPALVPEEFVLYRGWMSSQAFAAIPEQVRGREDFQFEREPRNGMIREALKQSCEACNGTGRDDLGYSTRTNADCPECGGDGKRHVSGARLQERGQHIEIR